MMPCFYVLQKAENVSISCLSGKTITNTAGTTTLFKSNVNQRRIQSRLRMGQIHGGKAFEIDNYFRDSTHHSRLKVVS
jgi:hypothetical protein